MKFKYTGIIEIEPCPALGFFKVIKGTEIVPDGQVMRLEYIKEHFTPVDCEAVDLVLTDYDVLFKGIEQKGK
uniref:Uncharacterized protein n=1 Tax=viral metagenome TaxID=1070528 RepID=A0A6H1ZJE0_9ZZZZ